MQRWAANTLRILAIIVTSLATLIASLLLLVLSLCSGIAKEGSLLPVLGAIMVVVVGIGIVVMLARGIAHSAAAALATRPYYATPAGVPSEMRPAYVPLSDPVLPTPPVPPGRKLSSWFTRPLSVSHEERKSLDLVRWALVAQVVASFLCWFLGQNFFWRAPSDVGVHSWTLRLLMPFLLYSFPYVILIVSFLTRPENRTLIYSLVVPAVLTLPTVVNLAVLAAVYIRHPAGFLLLFLPWSLHIVIMVLAWKAIRKIGLQPDGPALFRSGIVTCAYFFVIHLISPFFYLFLGR